MADLLDSYRRRLRGMHSLWCDAVDTMTIEHVNHYERDGVLPIAFSLFHYVNVEDSTLILLSGEPPIWDDQWAQRVRPAIGDHGKERSVEEMVDQRIGDYDAFAEYMRAVFAKTEAWLETLDPSELDRIVVERPLPEEFASTYSARVAGDEGITVLDALECWVYQHSVRHLGEIEHARALVGLGGMTS